MYSVAMIDDSRKGANMIRTACSPAAAATMEIRGGTPASFTLGMRSRNSRHFLGNDEPSLEDLLADDVLRRVMARDGVEPENLRALAEHVR